MENYDLNDRWGKHTVKVTFQASEYKGYVTYQIGGNTKGFAVLNSDPEDLCEHVFKENPVNLKPLDDDWYSMTLTNKNGDILLLEDEWESIGNHIIGVEIIDFEKEDL